MMRVLVIASASATQRQLQQQLEALPCIESVWSGTLAQAELDAPADWQVAVLDTTDCEQDALARITQWTSQFPKRFCVALHQRMDADIILSSIRAGAKEFVQYPQDMVSLSRIMERLDAQPAITEAVLNAVETLLPGQPTPRTQHGKLVGVFSPKGGGGGTTVAVNVAHQLVQITKQPVVVVDLNPQYEGFGHAFTMTFKHAIGDTARTLNGQPDALDSDVLQKLIHTHSSGLHLLAMCKSVRDDNPLISDGLLAKTLKELQKLYAWVVVDCPSQWVEDTHQRVFAMADHMIVVSMMDLPSLSRTQQYFSLVDEYLDPSKIRLVLNRTNLSAAYSISNQQLEEAFGITATAKLTNDWPLCIEAASLGQLLGETKPTAPLVKDLHHLAEKLVGKAPAFSPAPGTNGWLSRVKQAIRPQ